jgi:hypothetical protein
VLPGGEEVCYGYHVWEGDECVRCGLLDITPKPKPQPADPSPSDPASLLERGIDAPTQVQPNRTQEEK